MEVFVIGLLVLALVFVPIVTLREPMKIKKKYVITFYIVHRMLLFAVIIHNVYFQVIWVFAFLIIAIVEAMFIFCVTVAEVRIYAIIGFFLTIFSSRIVTYANDTTYYEHRVTYDYEITIENGEVIASYDDACYEVKDIVNEAVENMKKWNSTYYKGSVRVWYECKYPARYHSHDTECKCTDREICDACIEYLGKVKYVYKIES